MAYNRKELHSKYSDLHFIKKLYNQSSFIILKNYVPLNLTSIKRPLVNIVILVIVITNFQQKIQTHKKGKGRIHQCSQSFQSRSWFGLSISL